MGNLPRVVQDSILKSGSRENIEIWCYPTPQQRSVLYHHWLIFAAPFGSGKTLFMIIKAIELAENGEDVLFLIFAPWLKHWDPTAKPDTKTLLCLDLEEKFKNHSNIKEMMS